MKKLAVLLLCSLIILPMLPIRVYAYDDYEEWYVDPQNPEVQRIIRQVCKFPLEDNLPSNFVSLYHALAWRFSYCYACLEDPNHPDCHAWQTIPEMLRQNYGVCCDFARLYYSLLRGIGWPAHRIQIVYAPTYLFGIPTGSSHAWVEIKSASPSGTALALSANESITTLEGEELVFGFNDTMVTSSEITEEQIQEVQSLGFCTRNGWIPIDPTFAVSIKLLLFLLFPQQFLAWGYATFVLLQPYSINLNEVVPYYGPIWPFDQPPPYRRENPPTYPYEPMNLTVTIEPQNSFNVSYLHDMELYQMTNHIHCDINSTLPVDVEVRNPQMQVIDTDSGDTSYHIVVDFDYQLEPFPFPRDLGIYWFTAYNPQSEAVNVTFGGFGGPTMLWLGSETAINQTMYDQYSMRDIGVTDVTLGKTVVGQNYPTRVNVTVRNYGFSTETFNVTLYANATTINTSTNVTLSSGNTTTLTFTWNTTGYDYGNYTLKATATTVPGETDTTDNTLVNGFVMVTILGDVDGNRVVNIFDIGTISSHWYPGPPIGPLGYHANADINDDGAVDIFDIGIVSAHWGQSW